MRKYYVEFDFVKINNEVKTMQMKIFNDIEEAKEFAYQVESELIEKA